MKNQIRNIFKKLLTMSLVLAIGAVIFAPINIAWAENAAETSGSVSTLAMSPMINKIILNPGESYTGSFSITVPASATLPTNYEITMQNFYRDNDGNAVFEEINDTGRILNWTTIDSPTNGTLEPNESKDIYYTIKVPLDAPSGGQYVVITAKTASNTDSNNQENAAIIQEIVALGHIVYAEITGNTIHQGEILNIDLPSFIFSGNISASTTIKNTGNSHGTASYKMQVFPLFSDEEIYTNAEDPETHLILPGLLFYNETVWDNTPAFGIFNVVYTVEFEGVTQQVSKMVIKCPIWLLFIIIFVIAAIIIYFVMRAKSRKNSRKRIETE